MATERAEDDLFERLGIVSPTAATLPTERTCVRDSLATEVLGLEADVDQIFYDPETRPNPPMLAHLLFAGGYINILKTPLGTSSITLVLDGANTSRFGRGNDAHGEVGFATFSYGTGVVNLTDAGEIARISVAIREAGPRITAALSHPPEGSFLVYKPTSVLAAGR